MEADCNDPTVHTDYCRSVTTETAAVQPRRIGALRQIAANTIYLTTGGLLLSVPAGGGFAVASVIVSTVMLDSPHLALSGEELASARLSMILLSIVIGAATLVLCFFLGRLHRSRAGALLDVDIPRPVRRRRGWRRIVSLGVTPYGLRMVVYYLLGLLWGPLLVGVVLVCFLGSVGLVIFGLNLATTTVAALDVLIPLIGISLALGSPWILRAIARIDLGMLRWVHGVSEKAALAQRVQQVTEARSGVVAAADAERRRIERNLHDGAQQRLTALALQLGIERSRHRHAQAAAQPVDAQQTQQALEYAQTEVQAALKEIRELVRGLHPAVLEDRGLDAAVSGIASRVPFPVTVTVDIPQRPTLEVEAAAYFVVSEAVNNIIAHAKAEHAFVTVTQKGDRVQIEIDDDGIGGADERRGSGLIGLRQRVESVDGTLQIISAPEEGTQIRVELPCE